VLEPIEIKLAIYDLSGRQIHRLQSINSSAGNVQVQWDGRDASGATVPPGIYLYSLEVGSDDATNEHTGTLSLVY
jgi:flagellar basal-body rod modification protein FlgD